MYKHLLGVLISLSVLVVSVRECLFDDVVKQLQTQGYPQYVFQVSDVGRWWASVPQWEDNDLRPTKHNITPTMHSFWLEHVHSYVAVVSDTGECDCSPDIPMHASIFCQGHILFNLIGNALRFELVPEVYVPKFMPEFINQALKVKPGLRFLEIGCGVGIVPIMLKSLYPDVSVSCIDITPYEVNITRRNARLNGVDFDAAETNVLTGIFPKKFDLVYMYLPDHKLNTYDFQQTIDAGNVARVGPNDTLYVFDFPVFMSPLSTMSADSVDARIFTRKLLGRAEHILNPGGSMYLLGQSAVDVMHEFTQLTCGIVSGFFVVDDAADHVYCTLDHGEHRVTDDSRLLLRPGVRLKEGTSHAHDSSEAHERNALLTFKAHLAHEPLDILVLDDGRVSSGVRDLAETVTTEKHVTKVTHPEEAISISTIDDSFLLKVTLWTNYDPESVALEPWKVSFENMMQHPQGNDIQVKYDEEAYVWIKPRETATFGSNVPYDFELRNGNLELVLTVTLHTEKLAEEL